jgi:hypothetical protein
MSIFLAGYLNSHKDDADDAIESLYHAPHTVVEGVQVWAVAGPNGFVPKSSKIHLEPFLRFFGGMGWIRVLLKDLITFGECLHEPRQDTGPQHGNLCLCFHFSSPE